MVGRLQCKAFLRYTIFLQLCITLVSSFLHSSTIAIATSGFNSVTSSGTSPTSLSKTTADAPFNTFDTSIRGRNRRRRQPDGFRKWYTTSPSSTETDDSLSDISLGAPRGRPDNGDYISPAGIKVTRKVLPINDVATEIKNMVEALDDTKGIILTSSYEFPGRYARWTVGFVAPPLSIEGKGLDFKIKALNDRGKVLLSYINDHLAKSPELFALESIGNDDTILTGHVIPSQEYFPEEERSKQPTLFSLVRSIRYLFLSSEPEQLGLFGSFGYDLTFQFEPVEIKKTREDSQRDLLLYLPDEILVVDNAKRDAWTLQYDFEGHGKSTHSIPRVNTENTMSKFQFSSDDTTIQKRDVLKGAYAKSVIKAKEEFRVGNLFEVVLSQVFRDKLNVKPSIVFKRLCQRNPSPYGFFMNLGADEYLVGASPEMFVRVEETSKGTRVETCPISGTIERGESPLEDAQQIKKLLLSAKEESELTMCTDVDRNDKSRICVSGSVKVLGRRQIEMYSRLIHTVDHVEGYLREGFDALDAFMCHTWAVTVTGAPKTWAIRFLENNEPSPRYWYGGAVGIVGFDGTMNTGLTLRTIRVKEGVAEVRAGATLLHDSDPDAEEAETELKASALLDAINRPSVNEDSVDVTSSILPVVPDTPLIIKESKRVLLVDHEDSFVHTLANYLRQTGAEVKVVRSGDNFLKFLEKEFDTGNFVPDLTVLSPGPGSPSDFKLSMTIDKMIERKVPIFGVCLGLQGIVEHFGGDLDVLGYPMHGKPSSVQLVASDGEGIDENTNVLSGMPQEFQVARYHSLFAKASTFPDVLAVTAKIAKDDTIMAIQHKTLPIAAVQFHPESILTMPKHGMKILTNALENLKANSY